MVTAEEKRRINEAMTICNGDRKAAAESLNIPQDRLRALLKGNKDLNRIWVESKNDAPTVAEIMGGPALPKESPEQIEAREEAEFKKHIEALGTNPGDVTEAIALSKMYGRQIGYCVNLMGGGLTKRVMALLRLAEKLDKRFDDGFQGEGADAALANWSITYMEVHRMLANFLKTATLSQVAREKIKQLQESANGNRRGMPSFGPKKTTLIQATGPVQVNT